MNIYCQNETLSSGSPLNTLVKVKTVCVVNHARRPYPFADLRLATATNVRPSERTQALKFLTDHAVGRSLTLRNDHGIKL